MTTLIAAPTLDDGELTLTAALAKAQPGDTIQMRSGFYPGVYKLKTREVLIENYPSEVPVFTGITGKQKNAWLHIMASATGTMVNGVSFVREGEIETLFRQGWKDFGVIVEAPSVRLERCYWRGMCKGLLVKGALSTRLTVVHSEFGPTIQSNIVFATSYGVKRAALVAWNKLWGSWREDGIQFMPDYDAENIELDISTLGAIIYQNQFNKNNENHIDLKGAGDVVIDGNTLFEAMGCNDGLAFVPNRNAMGAITKGARTASARVIERNNVIVNNSSGVKVYDGYKVYNNFLGWNRFDFEGPGSTFKVKGRPVFIGVHQPAQAQNASIKNNVVGLHEADFTLPESGAAELDGNLIIRTPEEMTQAIRAAGLDKVLPWEDFLPIDGGPASGTGTPLTHTKSRGSGYVVPLRDVGYFTDWFGREDLPKDVIYIGDKRRVVVSVDYDANTVRVDLPTEWQAGEPVFWRSPRPDAGLQAEFVEPEPSVQLETVRLILSAQFPAVEAAQLRTLLAGRAVSVEIE